MDYRKATMYGIRAVTIMVSVLFLVCLFYIIDGYAGQERIIDGDPTDRVFVEDVVYAGDNIIILSENETLTYSNSNDLGVFPGNTYDLWVWDGPNSKVLLKVKQVQGVN